MKSFNYFTKLHRANEKLVILEWAYAILTVLSVIIAGLIALLNQSLGVGLLIVPLVSFVAFLMNIVTWALVKLLIDAVSKESKTANEIIESKKTKSKSKKNVTSKKK